VNRYIKTTTLLSVNSRPRTLASGTAVVMNAVGVAAVTVPPECIFSKLRLTGLSTAIVLAMLSISASASDPERTRRPPNAERRVTVAERLALEQCAEGQKLTCELFAVPRATLVPVEQFVG